MEGRKGCTAPVARPIPCKRSRTTGAAKQAGVCLVCLLLDTWAGVSPSSVRGIRATPPWRTSEGARAMRERYAVSPFHPCPR